MNIATVWQSFRRTQYNLRAGIIAAMVALTLSISNLHAATVVARLSGGPAAGYVNGLTTSATFHTPVGLALDEDDDFLFVADQSNNAVRVIALDDNSTFTFVPTNLLNKPVGVALDSDDDVFVLNRGNGTNGSVMEFDIYGDLLATNVTKLTNAAAIALDPTGNIYLTKSNSLIQISSTTNNFVPTNITIISTITNAGTSLQGIVVKQNGLIAACDSGNSSIWLIDPNNPVNGNPVKIAGFNGAGDNTNATYQFKGIPVASAKFYQPHGVAEAGDGSLIITDYGNHKVKVLNASGVVTNLYGVTSNYWAKSFPGFLDGTVAVPDAVGGVSTRQPNGIVFGSDGTVYVTEDYYSIIRKAATGLPLPPASLPPVPSPTVPQIGWVDNNFAFTPVSQGVFNNDVTIAINPNSTNTVSTFYLAGPTPLAANPSATSGSTPPFFQNGLPVAPLPVTPASDLTVKAVNVNANGVSSQVTQAEFKFVVSSPSIIGANAAAFVVSNITANSQMYYTIDGTTPTTNSFGPISSGSVSLNINSNFTFIVRGFRANYQPSGAASTFFTTNGFLPNTISFGFASGSGSTHYIASPGQSFFVPVSLSLLPSAPPIYGMQFNITLTNLGSSFVDPSTIYLLSQLGKPDVPFDGYYLTIPPMTFISTNQPNNDPNAFPYQGDWYQSLQFADTNNNDLLGVGWLEVLGRTNLYNTLSQNLLTYPIVYGTDPSANPNQMVIGAYTFGIPPNANPGDVYQIQIGRPSATTFAGLSVNAYGSPVSLYAPAYPNLLGPGSANALKNVTVGQIKYLVGDVYPANWYNAGDFGSSNLLNIDAIRVFDFAAYPIASPPAASDLYDALDSCGNIGVLDGATGYLTNTAGYPYFTNYPNAIVDYTYTYDTNGVLISTVPGYTADFSSLIYLTTYFVSVPYTITNIFLATPPAGPATNVVQTNYVINVPPGNSTLLNSTLFSGNDQTINQIAFGDGVLDVCDVYVTFERSLDTNSLVWFQRFWTNGMRVATANYAPAIEPASISKAAANSISTSITNQPKVNFFGTDFQALAGHIVHIPVTAQVFGNYPLRVLMLNLSVVPLDGSPALTTPVQFTPNSVLGSPALTDSTGNGNYAASWLNSGISGLTGSASLGTLTVTIPTNATALSAYAVHFDHASASPNGLASFPKQTLTSLVTLSSRNTSSFNDAIPDSWRLRYFGTTNNVLSEAIADADGDGVNNLQEYLAGTDPTDAKSYLHIGTDTAAATQSKDAVIHWPSVNGKKYIIWRSGSLFPAVWVPISTNNATGTEMEIHDLSGGNNRFYRVSAQ